MGLVHEDLGGGGRGGADGVGGGGGGREEKHLTLYRQLTHLCVIILLVEGDWERRQKIDGV